jgi:hypothetical protein
MTVPPSSLLCLRLLHLPLRLQSIIRLPSATPRLYQFSPFPRPMPWLRLLQFNRPTPIFRLLLLPINRLTLLPGTHLLLTPRLPNMALQLQHPLIPRHMLPGNHSQLRPRQLQLQPFRLPVQIRPTCQHHGPMPLELQQLPKPRFRPTARPPSILPIRSASPVFKLSVPRPPPLP